MVDPAIRAFYLDDEPNAIPTRFIDCSFFGRICTTPDPSLLQLVQHDVQTLFDYGVFVELQFLLNRATNIAPVPPSGTYRFYVYIFFDYWARLRHKWIIDKNTGKVSITQEHSVYCTGRIHGRLNEKYIHKVGYTTHTPKELSPVHVIIPGEDFRLVGTLHQAEYLSKGNDLKISGSNSCENDN